MYIKTTLASETVKRISQIWELFNDFSTDLRLLVYFAQHEEEWKWNEVLSLEDRKAMLEHELKSIMDATIALSN